MRESQRGNEKSNTQQLTGFEPKTCQISERHAARFYYNHCGITSAALIVTACETLQTFVIKIFSTDSPISKRNLKLNDIGLPFFRLKRLFCCLRQEDKKAQSEW